MVLGRVQLYSRRSIRTHRGWKDHLYFHLTFSNINFFFQTFAKNWQRKLSRLFLISTTWLLYLPRWAHWCLWLPKPSVSGQLQQPKTFLILLCFQAVFTYMFSIIPLLTHPLKKVKYLESSGLLLFSQAEHPIYQQAYWLKGQDPSRHHPPLSALSLPLKQPLSLAWISGLSADTLAFLQSISTEQ